MDAPARAGSAAYHALYEHPVEARRSGPLFSAFPYPTKIDPEAAALYIAAHTVPGEMVLDPFAGSGTTGVAALLCERPTERMIAAAAAHGLNPVWGPRDATLYELSPLGAFIGHNLTSPPDPTEFAAAAEKLIDEVDEELGWMYEAEAPDGSRGSIRHTVWSDQLRCPACLKDISLWDAAVTLAPAQISGWFICRICQYECAINEAPRVTTATEDDLIGADRTARVRRPAQVYGRSGKRTWTRPASRTDFGRLDKVAAIPIPSGVPVAPINWGDLHRAGYHEGITHLHHFYTRRNLIVFGRLWEAVGLFPREISESLRFWLLGYNSAHATLMTRVVAKQNLSDLAVTSGQPGVLYVSGLPVEKNLLAGLRRRINVVMKAFRQTYGCRGVVRVVNASSRTIALDNGTVDYVFTDPPFGGNIPYAEVNFVNEGWLGRITDNREEVIVSPSQGKSIPTYQTLLEDVFSEFCRCLKDSGRATVIFHSATASIWNALREAYGQAAFEVERASVLDKVQGSFKQVTTIGAVKGDPALLLRKAEAASNKVVAGDWRSLCRRWMSGDSSLAEAAPQRLYSRLVGHYLAADHEVPVSADKFYSWIRDQVKTDGISLPAQ